MEKAIRDYKIVREIGKGGMGHVYKAIDPKTRRPVAIKILLINIVDRSTVERFNREAQAMAKLKHPNLVEVYEVGMTKGQHYYVMEYVEGETLRSMVKHNGALPVSQCLKIVSQAAQALSVVHKEGMIHRDIKPGNIMVTKDGVIKLMDFGLVKIPGVTQVTAEGSAVGTAEYMSPEQISDEGVDPRSDIYSLGVTFYEILTGHPPFEGDNFESILMKHKYEAPPPMKKWKPQVPMDVERIAMRAMSKDLSSRYQRVEEFLNDVKSFDAPEVRTEVLSTAVVAQDAEKYKSTKKSPVPVIAAALVVAVGLAAGFLFREDVEIFASDLAYKAKGIFKKEGDLINETENQIKMFEKAEEHFALGQKFYREGLIDKSIDEYRKAIQLRKGYGAYYRELALAYASKNKLKKAVRVWKDLLKYDQTSSYADMARRQIEILSAQ